ncbi:MAG TPA: PilN domain-containing protein [Thermoanaerobaculia bacterium]|nr:PilN domain-containing protein [Thermoanaerobaculia bacterium]
MIRINLLAEAKPVRKKRGVSALGRAGRLNTVLIGIALGIAVLAILIHWWILSAAIKAQEEKIRVAQVEVTRLESVLKEVRDFEAKKAKLQKKVDLINQLKQNQKGPVRLMDEVSKALPDLVWLERLDYRGQSISIDGKAFNPPAVANFLENLKRVPAFQEPKVSFNACGGPGGLQLYCFNLSFVFSTLDKTQPAAAAPPPPKAGTAAGTAGM